MRSNPFLWIRLVMLIALVTGAMGNVWATPAHGVARAALAKPHPIDAARSSETAADDVLTARVLPVHMDADDIEIRTVAANEFPPLPPTRSEAREAVVHTPTSEGPDAWTAMLATLLLAAFFFVRRTF
jgi:MYXO-CTERM domain-containing protein